jgi:hypothetical protein
VLYLLLDDIDFPPCARVMFCSHMLTTSCYNSWTCMCVSACEHLPIPCPVCLRSCSIQGKPSQQHSNSYLLPSQLFVT